MTITDTANMETEIKNMQSDQANIRQTVRSIKNEGTKVLTNLYIS